MSQVLTDAFFESLESSTLALDRAETLPPACYVDRDFYEFEKEALFNHEWLCVGRLFPPPHRGRADRGRARPGRRPARHVLGLPASRDAGRGRQGQHPRL